MDNIDVMLEFISYESGHDLFVLDSNGEMAHVYVGEDDMTNDDGNLYRNHIIPMDLKQHEGHVIVRWYLPRILFLGCVAQKQNGDSDEKCAGIKVPNKLRLKGTQKFKIEKVVVGWFLHVVVTASKQPDRLTNISVVIPSELRLAYEAAVALTEWNWEAKCSLEKSNWALQDLTKKWWNLQGVYYKIYRL